MRRILIVTVVLAAVAAGVLLITRDGDAGAASYRFVSVTRGDLESTVTATGTLNPVRTVQVGTQVSGQIAELYVDFNDRVRKGQLIARLDPTLLEEAVRQAQADVDRAAADLAQKQFIAEQTAKMHERQAVTDTEYKTAQFNLQMSQASMKAAEANLERAKRNLQYASVYSPIDGVVIERNVDVGQTVAASLSAPQLFLIAEDLSRMQILASVDESDIGSIREGQDLRFTVQAYPNRTFRGRVRQVRMQSVSTENVVNYTVVADVENKDGALLPGMTATVTFEVAKATAVLKVANAALRVRPTEEMLAAVGDGEVGPAPAETATRTASGGATPGGAPARAGAADAAEDLAPAARTARLWYIDDQGRPAVVTVRTGLSDGQETEVSGPGLREGMRVIAAVTSGSTTGSTIASPFQTQASGRGRGAF